MILADLKLLKDNTCFLAFSNIQMKFKDHLVYWCTTSCFYFLSLFDVNCFVISLEIVYLRAQLLKG